MKKIINNPQDILEDSLVGLVLAYPKKLKRLDNTNVILRKELNFKKVNLISGGGTGHEPTHAGFVGKGMLDAAVCGSIFTSPAPDQILAALEATKNEKGTLLIIKNYTGDVMNFQLATQMYNLKTDFVIVNDDVAMEDSLFTTGRRGIAGTLFVHKLAGAKAEMGASLEEVKAIALKVISNTRSMGMSLSSCIVPEAEKANFILGEDEMEIGMGIHGEPGIIRKKIASAKEICIELLDKILEDRVFSNEVAIMINGLGSTPLMELLIMNKEVHAYLKEKNIIIYKSFVGEYMTSLEMAGASITLLQLDDELKFLLDAKEDTIGWK